MPMNYLKLHIPIIIRYRRVVISIIIVYLYKDTSKICNLQTNLLSYLLGYSIGTYSFKKKHKGNILLAGTVRK